MSEEEKLRNSVISNIRACIISTKGGIFSSHLDRDYCELLGEHIPYKKLGFKTLETFLKSIPDLKVTEGRNGDCYVDAKTDASSAHISNLVQGQKANAPKRSKKKYGFVPGLKRSSFMSAPPRYRGPPSRPMNKPKQFFQYFALPPQINKPVIPPSHNQSALLQSFAGPPLFKSAPGDKFPDVSRNKGFSNFSGPPVIKNGPPALVSAPRPEVKPILQPANEKATPKPPPNQVKTFNQPPQIRFDRDSVEPPSRPPAQNKVAQDTFKSTKVGRNPAQQRLLSGKKSTHLASPHKSFQKQQPRRSFGNSNKYTQSFSLVTDIPTNFAADSFVNKLVEYAHKNLWLPPEFYILNRKLSDGTNKVICRTSVVCSPVNESSLADSYEYSTYPIEFTDTTEAMNCVAEKAYKSLLAKNAIKLPETENHQIIVDRIARIVHGRKYGVWAFQIIVDYESTYGESLPKSLADILKISGVLDVNKLSEAEFIVYDKVLDSKKPKQESQISPILVLPDGDMWEVFVSRVLNVNQVIIRMIGPEYSVKYESLAYEMEVFYMKRNPPPANVLQVGRYYVHYDSETCSRVLLLEMVTDDSPRVMFIDHGDTEVVSRSSLYVIPNNFLHLPAQAVEAYLSGMDQFVCSHQPDRDVISDQIVGKSYIALVTSRHPVSIVLNDTSGNADVDVNESIKAQIIAGFSKPALTEVSQVVEVVVVNVNNEGDIFVNIPSETMKCLKEKLEAIDNGDLEVKAIASVDELTDVVYLLRGEQFQRAIIKQIISPIEVEIDLIDCGVIQLVKLQQLCYVPSMIEILSAIPHQALKVRLNDVSKSCLYTRISALREMLPIPSQAIVKLVKVEQGIPYIDAYWRTYPEGLLVSVNQTIIMEKQLKSNENKSCNSMMESLSLDEEEGSGNIQLKEEKFGLKKPSLPDLGKKFFDILVTDCAHPTNFTVQPVKYLPRLNDLMDEMSLFYNGNNSTVSQWKNGDLCAVPSKQSDGYWYRAYIVQLMGDSASVRFYDYGNMDVYPLESLRILEPQFKELPFVALNAKIHGIVPKHKDWEFEDSVRTRELLNYKKFCSVINDVITDEKNTFSTLSLEIIDTSSEEDVYIAHCLVLEGRACYA